MKKILIVSPHFPPVNAPDCQRVRMSLPYYAAFGWSPTVLTVRPEAQDLPLDPALARTVPADVRVVGTRALPLAITRPLGVGNVAIRAFGHLYAAGARIIRAEGIDLVYFSTTMFASMALGRLWKRRFGVPYVLDLQDPWFSTYYDDKPKGERPPKHALAQQLHRTLEPFTLRGADGVIAVSPGYLDTMRERYPDLAAEKCSVIPFGVSERDFEIGATVNPEIPRPFDPHAIEGVSVGRGGPDMATALQVLFRALRDGQRLSSRLSAVRLSFVGTDYAVDGRARPSVLPIAAAAGAGVCVRESTARVPYLDALARLRRADFLLVIGSDDPQYSPSKIYPCIASRRPIVAIVHERSPVAELVRRTRAGLVVTFTSRGDIAGPAAQLARGWATLVDRLPYEPDTDWDAFAPFSARALTARQCLMFDAAVQPRLAAEPQPCTE